MIRSHVPSTRAPSQLEMKPELRAMDRSMAIPLRGKEGGGHYAGLFVLCSICWWAVAGAHLCARVFLGPCQRARSIFAIPLEVNEIPH